VETASGDGAALLAASDATAELLEAPVETASWNLRLRNWGGSGAEGARGGVAADGGAERPHRSRKREK
jgi:hypothetical protein